MWCVDSVFIADASFDLELVYYTLEDAGFSLVYSINEADYVIISREVLNSNRCVS